MSIASIQHADVVIVGGGIWGLSTAYHLAKTGRAGRVVVLERNTELAAETSKQAAGQIGQLRSNPVMARAVRYTLDLLTAFRAETGHDPGLRTPGSLHLALCPERLSAFERQFATARALGIKLELATRADLHKRAPALDVAQIEGAIFVHGDGYVDARRTALAYGAAARDLGVEICTGVSATGFEPGSAGTRVRLARAAKVETLEAKHVVLAAGPWSALLAELADFVPPSYGIRLQQARTVADPALPEDHPVIRIPDRNCYLRPERGGYLYGYFDPDSTPMDPRDRPAGFTTSAIDPPVPIMDEARRLLAPIMPILEHLPIDEYRQGMVTCTPDGWYVLGPIPGKAGLWLATGCEAMGIAGSGAVGRWLASWIVEGDPGEDLSAMAPGRFGQRPRDRDWLREACRRTFASYYSLKGGATYSVGAERVEAS